VCYHNSSGVNMDNLEMQKIEEFVALCDDFIENDHDFAVRRIHQIIKSIGASEELFRFFQEKLSVFNFDETFANCFIKTDDGFETHLPDDEDALFCLAFCVLSDIDSAKINISQFVNNYFDFDEDDPMDNFAHLMVEPMKDVVARTYNIYSYTDTNKGDEDEQDEEMEEAGHEPEQPEQNSTALFEGLDHVLSACEEIATNYRDELEAINSPKTEYDDAKYIFGAIITACREKNIELLNGLVIGLNYVAKKVKLIRSGVREISELIYDFYEQNC